MKKALVTGAAGFVGSHLAEHLLSKNIAVTAAVHPQHSSNNLSPISKKISTISLDLTKKRDIKKIPVHFDYIFHLAASSSPAESFKKPEETFENNVFSQLYFLENLVRKKSKAKILIVGSADEYGNVEKKYLPVNEDAPLNPNSPYAISKVAQDLLGYQFFLNEGLNIIRVRPFNHIGPRQSPNFVVPSFALQIAQIEQAGGRGVLKTGDLNTYRDFTDVRDVVRAYLLVLDKGTFGEVYNIGSGTPYKISDILNKLLSYSTADIKVVRDKKFLRSSDIQKIYCDFSKIKKATGWQPMIEINKTLFDTIEYERSKSKK